MSYFTAETFDFVRDLRVNNDRDWFMANKSRYESAVVEPSLAFISDFDQRLETISRHFVAIPKRVGGSMFRIYRDTRFSKDKSPYKTHVGIHFRHRQAKDVHAPGFYLHMEPGQAFAGAGIWRPDKESLQGIREAIADDPEGWRTVSQGSPFATRFRLDGDRLKRPPRGFDAEHPAVEELKRKDFIGVTDLEEDDVIADDFMDRFTAICGDAGDFVRYLSHAVGVPY